MSIFARVVRKLVSLYRLKSDPIGFARSIGVRVGRRCRFIGVTQGTFGSEPYLVTIGDHVTITAGVSFVTHDGGVWIFREADPDIDVLAPIVVGDNVFLGLNTIVMPGVTIGSNCVIGAGSVVSRDIPPNTVAAGVPAKPIRGIAEYRERIGEKAIRIRSLPEAKKRGILMERFGIEGK
jgi:acetyltransferase-like isoleucine patch superfamily enzyme